MNKKTSILVVDDDVDILFQISTILKETGYEVVSAEGEAAADEKLIDAKPDLAVVDIMMENQDSGFMLCHKIKKLYPGTPVIILTSVSSLTGLKFPIEAGGDKPWIKADSFLNKPVRAEMLRSEVKRLLETCPVRA
jgi:two-component system alkaline phosphatase synthesis response regulator PhoP